MKLLYVLWAVHWINHDLLSFILAVLFVLLTTFFYYKDNR